MATNPNQLFGWKPDLPDHRDHYFSAKFMTPSTLVPFMDLRSSCPTSFNQLSLGSCTANAVAGALKFDQTIQKMPNIFTSSRLFIYYNSRVLEGTVYSDSGASLRNAIKSVNKWGACPDADWTYDIGKFTVKPPTAAYSKALQHRALAYQRVDQDLYSMQSCLASGFPFVLGFSVYENFMTNAMSQTGLLTMPTAQERSLGGHAVLAIGYNDGPTVNGIPPRHFLVHNSWGPGWGVSGNFYMPYEYLTNSDLASDFWTIKQVS